MAARFQDAPIMLSLVPRSFLLQSGLAGWSVVASLVACGSLFAETQPGPAGFRAAVAPLFEAHCVKCHGPEKKKGKITLHDLGGDLAAGHDLEKWESVLDMLMSGEMPPEDESQPSEAARTAAAKWIEEELRAAVAKEGEDDEASVARRLTNIEYENTMRDLLGFQLDLIENLPKDPVKPYAFNNTAEFMRLGPEQVDRYLECARRAMASAIVDPEVPEVHKSRREWLPHGLDKGLGSDELGVWGNRRHTPSTGMGLKSFPATGEFRIRFQASAILPPGIRELPLRLVMGYSLNINSSTQRIAPVGLVRLRNNPDDPQVFEFRGRIENHPAKPGLVKNGRRLPDSMTITPQNLYDDGTLNDGKRNLALPRAVINWMEFEAPVVDTWPPEHHTRILFDSPQRDSDPDAYVAEVLERFLSRAYRRPATDEEIARFAAIYRLVRPELGSLEAAMRETLAMALVSPQFLYHTVAGDETLRSYELASRLSYFLWGSMPDGKLLAAAADGKLDDPSAIAGQVRRLLADERADDFVRNFTMQWLSLAKMKTVPINRELFPRFLYYVPAGERAGTEEPYRPTIRDYMIDETVGFVAELIRRNRSVLEIVDSDFAMLNQPLAAHYGIEGVQGDALRPVKLKEEDRLGGLLTHGSMLIGNGTGSAPHPIYRAVWLREAILGDEVAPPPAEVPALSDSAGESAEKALTIKDLLAKHRQVESCNDCHVRLDPWGIPFERYNAIGKYQPRVPKEGTRVSAFNKDKHRDLAGYAAYLETINTVEVEADARVPSGPEVDGMEELKTYLLENRRDEIAENVLRRLLSYSRHADAAVDPQRLAVHVVVGDELDHHRRQLVRGAQALGEEHALPQVRLELLRPLALPVDGRVDQAGCDRVHADPDGRQVARHGKRHADDAALRGGVGGLSDLAVERRDRRQVHDGTALPVRVHRILLRHGRRGEPQAVEAADQVHTDHELELVERKGLAFPVHRAVGVADSRGVQQTAQGGQRQGLIDGGLHLIGVRHVGLHEGALQVVGDRLALLFVEIGHDDLRSQHGQAPRAGLSDARRAAGDDDGCSIQLHGGPLLSSPENSEGDTSR